MKERSKHRVASEERFFPGKIMATAFCDCQIIIFNNNLAMGKTIEQQNYLFHQNNALAQLSAAKLS